MNPSLTDAIKEAFASAPVTQVIHNTLEINQTGVQDPIFLVQGMSSLTAQNEKNETLIFEPCGFQFQLPPSSDEGFQYLTVSIDNIDRRVTVFIETALQEVVPVKMTYRPYLSTDLTRPQMNPPLAMFLREIQISATQVTGRATFMDLVNRQFPSVLYTRRQFPTLG